MEIFFSDIIFIFLYIFTRSTINQTNIYHSLFLMQTLILENIPCYCYNVLKFCSGILALLLWVENRGQMVRTSDM